MAYTRAGKVITGFSNPMYCLANGTPKALARGVDVSISVTATDEVVWYADNGRAESMGGGFKEGSLTLNCDTLLPEAEQAIHGITAPTDPDTWQSYLTTEEAPNVAVGFLVRYVCGGTTYYTPMVLPRAKFKPETTTAKTQSETIEFQTTSLEAILSIDETNCWKYVDTAEYNDIGVLPDPAASPAVEGSGALKALYNKLEAVI